MKKIFTLSLALVAAISASAQKYGLYTDTDSERKEAFARLEQLRRKGTVTDDDAEWASYREEKYGK